MRSASRRTDLPARSILMIAAARLRALIATSATASVSAAANPTAGPKTRRGNTLCRCAPTSVRLCAPRISFWIESTLPDAKRQHAVRFRRVLELVAGLPQQVRDVDGRERIGTFRNDQVTALQSRQFLADPQRGQRTFQSTQIHHRFSHTLSGTIESCLSVAGI